MACIDPASIRDIGIIAHIDAGKTTLSERILFYTRKIHRIGEVHDGAATMDYMPEEQERGITITSACSTCVWKNININLVDTPGHVDFTMEVERSLRVLDGAIGVFCAVGGVEPQSETVWRQSQKFSIPTLAFINKMDREGANFNAVLEAMRARLGANPAAIVIPLDEGNGFNAILDLITDHKLVFDSEDQGRTIIATPFNASEKDFAQPWKEKLLETVAEADDDFMAKWYEGAYTQADLQKAIRRATLACRLTPCLAGAALRNIGVQPLLDAVVNYLPSPLDAPPAVAETPQGEKRLLKPELDGPPVGLVFKIVMDGSRKNAFFRLYSGRIEEGQTLANVRTGRVDRIGRLLRLHADRHEKLDCLGPGDIAAITGLRDAQTGDSYAPKNDPLLLMPIAVYTPVITIALEPLNADEGKLLDEALTRYSMEDPTLVWITDEDNGLRELSGMGELHLEVTLERLRREYKINPRAGQPKAVLRETILKDGQAHVNFEREFGKEKHQGDVELTISPRPRGSGNLITDYLPADNQEARKILPQAMLDAVHDGLKNAMATGVTSGWPLADAHVHIANIIKTDNLTTLPGLTMAATQALREAVKNSQPALLEPVMEVSISCPEEFLGNAIGLFTQCGGKIEGMGEKGDQREIKGIAPLRKLFGFSTPLRSATQGRAGFSMTFKNYDLV